MPGRPLDSEVLLDESRTVLVNSASQLNGFLLALSLPLQSAYLLFEGGIYENVEGIRQIVQIVCRPAAYQHAVAFASGSSYDLFGDLANSVGVRDLQRWRDQASFVAASQEGFK